MTLGTKVEERFAAQHVMCFGLTLDFGRLSPCQQRGRPRVDIALRLNVLSALAVCAAFAFIGAIVLGAF